MTVTVKNECISLSNSTWIEEVNCASDSDNFTYLFSSKGEKSHEQQKRVKIHSGCVSNILYIDTFDDIIRNDHHLLYISIE